jgi:hypothetical protein
MRSWDLNVMYLAWSMSMDHGRAKGIVQTLQRRRPWLTPVVSGASYVAGMSLFVLYIRFSESLHEGPDRLWMGRWSLVTDVAAIGLAFGVFVGGLVLLNGRIMVARARRLLETEGPGPWCASCSYPLTSVPPRDGEITCPECGSLQVTP